jgi:hypothetical protein
MLARPGRRHGRRPFLGRSSHDAFGDWKTVCEVVEVEDQRRWGLERHRPRRCRRDVRFEVEPAGDGVLIRQWGRMGPGPSGLTPAILAQPDKEAREIVRWLSECS